MKKLILAALLALSAALPANAQTATAPGVTKCKATTLAGKPCSRFGKPEYCSQHNPESARCSAPTKAGGKCSRVVKTAGSHCKQHSTQ